MIRRLPAALAALALCTALGPARADTPAFVQALAQTEDATLADLYRARAFAPLWTGAQHADRRAALVSALDMADLHGLPAARHDPAPLIAQLAAVRTEADRAAADAAATHAFLRLARDLHGGVLDPRRVDDTIRRSRPTLDTEALLARLDAAGPTAALRDILPAGAEYNGLLRARAQLIARRDAGGWGPPITADRLRPGDSGPAVVALRDRLMAMGYLDRSVSGSYDAQLMAAVQAAQIAHGLTADGLAGPVTLRALNTPLEDRITALTVALERERWMNFDRGDRHIWVNLADYTTRVLDGGQITYQTRSIIGDSRPEMQTYEFSEAMTYLEINPDWTVPRGMLGRSYLGALQSNPHAFPQFQVIDASGRVVARDAVPFAAHSARSLPYRLRQPPGPANPLGRVKFMFPNPYAIYLHDTPDRQLFDRDRRALSNGCIRLSEPAELAHILLAPQFDDPVAEFDRIHRSGRQTRVFLDDPVPVHLVYRTAFLDTQGQLAFREDIYGRDARVAAALDRAGVRLLPPGS